MNEIFKMFNINNILKVSKRSEMEYSVWSLKRDLYLENNVATIVYGDDDCKTVFIKLSQEECNMLKNYLERIISSR